MCKQPGPVGRPATAEQQWKKRWITAFLKKRVVLLSAMIWLSGGGVFCPSFLVFCFIVCRVFFVVLFCGVCLVFYLFQKLRQEGELWGKQQSCSFPATVRLVDKGARSPGDTSQTPRLVSQLLMCSSSSCRQRTRTWWLVWFCLGFSFVFLKSTLNAALKKEKAQSRSEVQPLPGLSLL